MYDYYYHENGKKKGPINFETLKEKIESRDIGKNDLLWREEFEDWQKAGEFEELTSLFKMPPPLPNKSESTPNSKKATPPELPQNTKKKKKGKFLLWLIPLLLLLGIGGSYFYQQHELAEAKRMERKMPIFYLTVSEINHRTNLALTNIFKGAINSEAHYTTYNNIQLIVSWYDKNNKQISTSRHTISKKIRPWGNISFEIRTNSPLRAKTYDITVNDAKAW